MHTNKIVTLGSSGAGKTSILSRFMSNVFDPTQTTSVGIDWFSKTVFFQENGQQKEVKLYVWDTSGQERFASLAPSYVKDARIVLLVFDLNKPESLQALLHWWQQAQKSQTPCQYVLVGNKSDLERKCMTADIDQIKIQTSCTRYFEVSAKDGSGIQQMFIEIGKELYKLQQEEEKKAYVDPSVTVTVRPTQSGSDGKSGGLCC